MYASCKFWSYVTLFCALFLSANSPKRKEIGLNDHGSKSNECQQQCINRDSHPHLQRIRVGPILLLYKLSEYITTTINPRMANDQVYYSKGFKKSVSDTHAWRTVDNSTKFITSVLRPDFKVLDVGCGPGSITVDLAKNYLNENGSVIGVEPTQELIDTANEFKNTAAPSLNNVKFQTGSIYELPFEDNTFDLVLAHQVIIHLQDPIKGLQELARVTKSGGYVAVKDADLESIIASPEKYELLRNYFVEKAKNAVSTDIKAGRTLREKAVKAGYKPDNITTSKSYWLLADDIEAKKQWVELTNNRIKNGGEVIYPNDEKKNEEVSNQVISKWEEWVNDETSLFNISHFEIVYKKPV